MGTLYVVATPIGNLEDVTLRALRVLSEVGLIAAEDTRVTRKLLGRHGVRTPLVSFREHTTPARRAALVARLAGADMALVSDAGTPGVSDPGAALVADALAAGHAVVAVPGPSAVAAALSVSGLPADAYVFLGFLPRRAAERRAELARVAAEHRTLVLFEAPHRFQATMADLAAVLGTERTVTVTRELTKRHEQVWRGRLADVPQLLADVPARGEIAVVVAGRPADEPGERWSEADVGAAVGRLRADGLGARDAARRVAARSGWTAREVYELAHRSVGAERSERAPGGGQAPGGADEAAPGGADEAAPGGGCLP